MPRRHALTHRIEKNSAASVRSWERPSQHAAKKMKSDAVLHMGWGRLFFAHTFDDQHQLGAVLQEEKPGQRDVAFYVRDPHVILSYAPQELFLDPSHTYRIWLSQYRLGMDRPQGLLIRRIRKRQDIAEINRIYESRQMVCADPDYLWAHRRSRVLTYVVAEDANTKEIVGVTAGVDHELFFHDPEHGASLWSLAVDGRAVQPGIGEALVRYLCEHYQALGRAYLDLSVMHNNDQAVTLYEKLGFKRVPVFCLKHKSPINEPLYVSPQLGETLNPYADIIIREARRRGIVIDVIDAENAYFSLSYGGRTILCRESLTELTSAISMSWCDNKQITLRLLSHSGLRTPAQIEANDPAELTEFLHRHQRVVVKPARGEQGQGISVDIRTPDELLDAVKRARDFCDVAIVERMVPGMDLRIIVIDYQVVAAAVRKPPAIVGTGQHSILELIEKLSRRRMATTGGESQIPLDAETERCVAAAGYKLDDILDVDETLVVRKTANLHTGGTIHDVTDELHPTLIAAAEQAARTLNIPVVGLDFIVPAVDGPDYVVIEANERPGLANHEPQPTAERFIDLLFPHSR